MKDLIDWLRRIHFVWAIFLPWATGPFALSALSGVWGVLDELPRQAALFLFLFTSLVLVLFAQVVSSGLQGLVARWDPRPIVWTDSNDVAADILFAPASRELSSSLRSLPQRMLRRGAGATLVTAHAASRNRLRIES